MLDIYDICCNRWNCLCTEASAALGSPKSKTASTANLGTTLGTPAVHDLRSKKYQKIWANWETASKNAPKKKLPFRSWYHPWLTRRGQGMANRDRFAVSCWHSKQGANAHDRPWSHGGIGGIGEWNSHITIASVHNISPYHGYFRTHITLISHSYHTHIILISYSSLNLRVCLKAFWVHHCNWRQKLSDTTSL